MNYSDPEPEPDRFGEPDPLRLPLRLRSEPLRERALPLCDRDLERDERESVEKRKKNIRKCVVFF